MDEVALVSTASGAYLLDELRGLLGVPAMPCLSTSHHNIQTAPGDESTLLLPANVRSRHIFVVASPRAPVNDSLVEAALLVSALRRSSVERITCVLPYFAYGRQSYKTASRVPVSAADVALALEEMGTDALITVDLHRGQTAGFFSPRCSVDNLTCIPVGARYFWRALARHERRVVVVSPHASGVGFAKEFLDALLGMAHEEAPGGGGGATAAAAPRDVTPTLAVLVHRPGARKRELELLGSVEGCDCVVVDDIIDSGKAMARSCAELLAHGAERVFGFATHPVLSAGSHDTLAEAAFERIIVTNTVPTTVPRGHPIIRKLVVLSAAPALAHQIARVAGLPPPEALEPLATTFAFHGPDKTLSGTWVGGQPRADEQRPTECADDGLREPSPPWFFTQSERHGKIKCALALLAATAPIREADFSDRVASLKFACGRLQLIEVVLASTHVIEDAPQLASVNALKTDAQGIFASFAGEMLAHEKPGLDAAQLEIVAHESKRLGTRVHHLFNTGKYTEALHVAEEQHALLRNAYGPMHHECATAMNNVATLYQTLGRHADAEPLLLEASRVQQRTLGDDHPHTVASLSNLATVYEAMGQKERARAMQSLVGQMKSNWEAKQKRSRR